MRSKDLLHSLGARSVCPSVSECCQEFAGGYLKEDTTPATPDRHQAMLQ